MTLIKPRGTGPAVHLLGRSCTYSFKVTVFTVCIAGFNITKHAVCRHSYFEFHKKRRPACGLTAFHFRII
jgi:hypothetical protein